jgi:acetoacetyl-CoA synthetase
VREGTLLWEPSPERAAASNLAAYMGWLRERHGLAFDGYDALWRWSVADLPAFWASIWDYFGVEAEGSYREVLKGRRGWFEGTRLNYARHALREGEDERPALLHRTERGALRAITRGDLRDRVARVAAALRAMGIRPGDRVVAYLPNVPETAIAFLACASLGATWSCCSPDFGAAGTVDRFRQIEPTLLLAIDGYRSFDRRDVVEQIRAQLPTLRNTVLVPHLDEDGGDDGLADTRRWAELLAAEGDLSFADVPFDHPLWILYSSGTTGPPKAIVHGHGGILLEHLKTLHLQLDLAPGDRFLWFTTSGWMMWNLLVGAPLVGAAAVLYEGSRRSSGPARATSARARRRGSSLGGGIPSAR